MHHFSNKIYMQEPAREPNGIEYVLHVKDLTWPTNTILIVTSCTLPLSGPWMTRIIASLSTIEVTMFTLVTGT